MALPICQSTFWDTNLTWHMDDPDFTPCFQKTALVWAPCAVLWLFLPFEMALIWKTRNRISWFSSLNVRKLLLVALLTSLTAFKLGKQIYQGDYDLVDNFSEAILFGTYVLAMLYIVYGSYCGLLLSGIQLLFWFLLAISQTITLRSAIMDYYRDDNQKRELFGLVMKSVSYPLIIITMILNTLSDTKRKYVKHLDDRPDEKVSPEEDASFLSRMFHSWLTNALWRGWKNNIELPDVYELNLSDKAITGTKKFEKHFKYRQSHSMKDNEEMKSFLNNSQENNNEVVSIMIPLLKTFWPLLLFGAIFQILSDIFECTIPFIIGLIIDYSSNDDFLWKGIFYASLMGFVSLMQSLLIEGSAICNTKLGLRLKSTTMHVLYKKTLRLSSSDHRSLTIGEILNTMYVDTQRFVFFSLQLGTMWSILAQICLCFYFLYQQLGYSAFVGLVMLLATIPVNFYVSRKTKQLQGKLMKTKDKRMKMMSEILNGIRILKLYAWEKSYEKIVTNFRNVEISKLRKQGILSAVNMGIFHAVPFLITISSFGTFLVIDENHVLTSTKMFVSYQLIRSLSLTLFFLPDIVDTLVLTKVSLSRINKVLNSNETVEYVQQGLINDNYSVAMSKATFSWNKTDHPFLRNINFKVPRGSLVAIVGPVGSGKSSLLSALVCEMEKLEGQVRVSGKISYVPQQPWIQNASLKENILFIDDMDEERYNKVTRACALQYDLNHLPAYDETEIGERGINLSGGQKQRVNVARAVYRTDDIFLLDDPLGAVDAHVAKHIFNEVIGRNGLLRNNTRLLVTHNLAFLRHVDEIVFMSNGAIIERGTYDEIMSREGIARDYFEHHMNDTDAVCNESLISSRQEESIKDHTNFNSKKGGQSKLTTAENLQKGHNSLPVCKEYLKSMGIHFGVTILVLLLFNHSFYQGSLYWMSLWSEDSKYGPKVEIDLRKTRLITYGLLGVGICVTSFTSVAFSAYASVRVTKLFHQKMLYSVLRSPLSFFDTTPSGRILNRFSQDVDALDKQLLCTMRSSFFLLVGSFAMIIATTVQLPVFIVPVILVFIGFGLIQRFFVKTSLQLKRIVGIRNSFLFSHVSSSVSGTTVIKVCNAANKLESRFLKQVDDSNAATYMMNMAQRWLNLRLNLLGNVLLFSASLFAVLNKGSLSPGIVGFVICNAAGLIAFGKRLVMLLTEVETCLVSVERIYEYCNLESEAEWDKPEWNLSPEWPQKGKLVFRDYCTRYREELDLVLKNLNLIIEPGEKVGVVGRTGAGKSSMTLALFRLIEKVSGQIVIDGVDVSEMGLSDLRSRLTIIPQEPILFSGTLRQNLDPFGQHDDHRLWLALEHSHLKSFVKSLDRGLDHALIEGGGNFSVGQRQLVCLARALLRNTKILILDEATASVDMDTDDLIQATIRKEFVNSTVITIAHRINTILDYDRVMVLDQGQVVEFETPRNLLKNKHSLFHELAKDANILNVHL